MRGETHAAAVLDAQLPVIHDDQGLTVQKLSDCVVIGLNPLEAYNHDAPDEQNQDVLQNGDSAVIDGAADHTTEYIVLNLIACIRGG